MKQEDLFIKQISSEIGLDEEVIKEVYKSFWEFIRNTIVKLPLKEELSKEEFDKLKTSFNIPSIGKLYCSYDKIFRIKTRYNNIKNIREKSNENKKD